MNPKLRDARRKFQGQTAKVQQFGGPSGSLTEGVHTFEVTDSRLADKTRKGVEVSVHSMMLKCIDGDDKGKMCWPFAPDLDSVEGLVSSSRNISNILGDVLPGQKLNNGEFQLDIPAFLEQFDSLAAQCIGEIVEARIVNQKTRQDGSHLRDDGTPWQNVFIQRGLGEDAKGVDRSSTGATRHDPDDNLNFDPPPGRPAGRKKTAKKKVVKKKVVKKKAKKKSRRK